MDHGLSIYTLDYLTQKIQTLMKYEWYMARRDTIKKTCCTYKDDLTPTHKTTPGINLENFS
jgi:hypothetical protein